MNAPATGAAPTIVQRGSFELTLRRLLRDKAGLLALGFILLLVAFALGAGIIEAWTGHSAFEQYRDTGLTPTGMPVGVRPVSRYCSKAECPVQASMMPAPKAKATSSRMKPSARRPALSRSSRRSVSSNEPR